MDVVKSLQQRRYKKFEDGLEGPPPLRPGGGTRVRDDGDEGSSRSVTPPPRKYVTAGPQPNVQVVQITESLSGPDPYAKAAVPANATPSPQAVVEALPQRLAKISPVSTSPTMPGEENDVRDLENRIHDLEARLAMTSQRNLNLMRQFAEKDAQMVMMETEWGQERVRYVTEVERNKAHLANREVDLRVARNAERRAKEVLALKQAELQEAEAKLASYARMYGRSAMERMNQLTSRISELESALAEAQGQVSGPPSGAGAEGGGDIRMLRQQLRMAAKDRARLLQQNRSLTARVGRTPRGSTDFDAEGVLPLSGPQGSFGRGPSFGSDSGRLEKLEAERTLSLNLASHPLGDGSSTEESEGLPTKAAFDELHNQHSSLKRTHAALQALQSELLARVGDRGGPASPSAQAAEVDMDPFGVAAALRVRLQELEEENTALQARLTGLASKEISNVGTQGEAHGSDASYAELKQRCDAAERALVRAGLRPAIAAGVQLWGSRSQGVAALRQSLEQFKPGRSTAAAGKLEARVAELEAANSALHADLERAVDALEAAAEREAADSRAIQILSQRVPDSYDEDGGLSWEAVARAAGASSSTPQAASVQSHPDTDAEVERLTMDLEAANALLADLTQQYEAEREVEVQKAEIQEQLLGEEQARRRRLEEQHEDTLQQLEGARAELAVLREPVQSRMDELSNLRDTNMRLSRQLEEALRTFASRERAPQIAQERQANEEEDEVRLHHERLKREHGALLQEVESLRAEQQGLQSRLDTALEELRVSQTAKAALQAQVSSSSSLREQHVGAAAAQLEAVRADLEAVEGQLRTSQQEVASLRKLRLEEAAAAAADIRAVKQEARKREDELLSSSPATLRPVSRGSPPATPLEADATPWSDALRETGGPFTTSGPPGKGGQAAHGLNPNRPPARGPTRFGAGDIDAEAMPHLRPIPDALVLDASAPEGAAWDVSGLRHVSDFSGEPLVPLLPDLSEVGRRSFEEHPSPPVSGRYPEGSRSATSSTCASPMVGGDGSRRLYVTPRAEGSLEADLAAARNAATAYQNEVRMLRGQLESAAAARAAAEENASRKSAEAKSKSAELSTLQQDHKSLSAKHAELSAEFTAFRRGVEEAGATALQVVQLQAKVRALEAAREELESGLPALRAAAEGNMAALAAAQEEAEQQRKEARASAIKAEERGLELDGLRAEVRRTEARLRATQANLAAQQDKAELQARMTRQYVEEFERERALRARLQAHLAPAHKDATALKEGVVRVANGDVALIDLAASLQASLGSMAVEGDQPRQGAGGRAGEERAGGVSVVSMQSTLLLEAQRRSEEAEAVRGILHPTADLGLRAIRDISDDEESEQAVQAQFRVKAELDQARQKAVDLVRERLHLEQCVRYLAVRAGLAYALDRNSAVAARVGSLHPGPVDDVAGAPESLGEAVHHGGGVGAAASALPTLGLVLSKELKDVRDKARDEGQDSATAPAVEASILARIASLCAVPPLRRRGQGDGMDDMGRMLGYGSGGPSPAASPVVTPRTFGS